MCKKRKECSTGKLWKLAIITNPFENTNNAKLGQCRQWSVRPCGRQTNALPTLVQRKNFHSICLIIFKKLVIFLINKWMEKWIIHTSKVPDCMSGYGFIVHRPVDLKLGILKGTDLRGLWATFRSDPIKVHSLYNKKMKTNKRTNKNNTIVRTKQTNKRRRRR